MNLNSPAFTSMGMIPKKYTCQGDDLSPPLVWTEVPESAQSPCPPKGCHRNFFKVYALDTVLPDLAHPNKAELEKAAQQHVLAKTELVGTCQK